jgi:hypothetical protein
MFAYQNTMDRMIRNLPWPVIARRAVRGSLYLCLSAKCSGQPLQGELSSCFIAIIQQMLLSTLTSSLSLAPPPLTTYIGSRTVRASFVHFDRIKHQAKHIIPTHHISSIVDNCTNTTHIYKWTIRPLR